MTHLLSLLDFARLILDAIEATASEYMLGGALAVMAYAEARATQDVDVVVNLPVERIQDFSGELKKRQVLIPPELMLERFIQPQGDTPLSGVHLYSGQRADIFLLQEGDPLRVSALARKRLIDLGNPLGQVNVHAPEDLILYKLRYFAISEQDKHIRDIAALLYGQHGKLDEAYLNAWTVSLGLEKYWQQIQTEVSRRWESLIKP
ncbi:MAG TPA: hypothetical protein PK530_15390 [Anaerolineales bacterium]|nr:hypothetical protein [Anaerolineales bacterium]